MDYISYILVIVGILALVFVWVRRTGQIDLGKKKKASVKMSANKSFRKTSRQDSQSELERATHALSRQTLHVPTPWGWPGSDVKSPSKRHQTATNYDTNGVSDSLHRLVDLMVSEKQTVENREYLLRKDASMRALIEDRYGQTNQPKEIEFKKVKPPRLRDPSEPPDQLDSFNNGEADKIADQLLKDASAPEFFDKHYGSFRERAYLKNMKTPWGW